jgi:hypothetical protein
MMLMVVIMFFVLLGMQAAGDDEEQGARTVALSRFHSPAFRFSLEKRKNVSVCEGGRTASIH